MQTTHQSSPSVETTSYPPELPKVPDWGEGVVGGCEGDTEGDEQQVGQLGRGDILAYPIF